LWTCSKTHPWTEKQCNDEEGPSFSPRIHFEQSDLNFVSRLPETQKNEWLNDFMPSFKKQMKMWWVIADDDTQLGHKDEKS
jgi:hypothetical protein